MNRNLFILLISILYCLNIVAQKDVQRDSIDQLIESEINDTLLFNHISFAISDIGLKNVPEIKSYFQKGINLCSRFDDKKYLLRLYIITSRYLYYAGHVKSAMEMYNETKSLARKYKYKEFEASANVGISEFHIDGGNKDKAKQLLLSTIDDLKDSNLQQTLSELNNRLAIIYRDEGQYRLALNHMKKALSYHSPDDISRLMFSNYSTLGRIYRFMGNNDSAKISYKKAEDITIRGNDEQALSTVLNNLGNIEHVSGNYDNAISYYMRSLKIKEKYGNKRGTSIAFHNIGAIKYDMKSYEDAILDFNKSNEIGYDINYKPIIVYNEQKIGNCYRALSDINKALEYHNNALKIAKEIKFDNGIIEALQNIGHDNIILNNFEEADKNLVEALARAKKSGSKPFESSILVHISNSYLKNKKLRDLKGENIVDNSAIGKNVESYLLRAKELADEMQNVDNQKLALEGLNQYYNTTKQYRKNVKIMASLMSLKDTLFLKERTEAIADWETKYETAEKEKEIIQLEVEQKVSKARVKLWSIISFLLLTIIAIGTYLFLQLKKARLELQSRNIKLNELNKTKDKFFGIIAHDIRSPIVALESVDEQMNYFLEKNKTEKLINLGSLVGRTARHLNNLLDNLLNWALLQTKNIPFNPEPIIVNDIVSEVAQVMQVNLEIKRINLEVNIPFETTINADYPSLSTVFRNLISNAIKYSQKDSTVSINYSVKDNKNYFEIKDQGLGIPKEKISELFTLDKKSQKGTMGEKGTGLGLILCKELVELHGGEIKIESSIGNGTTVSFYIPNELS